MIPLPQSDGRSLQQSLLPVMGMGECGSDLKSECNWCVRDDEDVHVNAVAYLHYECVYVNAVAYLHYERVHENAVEPPLYGYPLVQVYAQGVHHVNVLHFHLQLLSYEYHGYHILPQVPQKASRHKL